MAGFVELISQVGFPIVAFVLMFRLYRDERANRAEEREQWLNSIQEHTEAVRSLRRSLDQRALADGGQDAGEG